MNPKYPHIVVRLNGRDLDAFNTIGLVRNALRDYDVPQTEIVAFLNEVWADDHDRVLATVQKWVTVE